MANEQTINQTFPLFSAASPSSLPIGSRPAINLPANKEMKKKIKLAKKKKSRNQYNSSRKLMKSREFCVGELLIDAGEKGASREPRDRNEFSESL